MSTLTCFKAYDIRGRLGEELNEAVAYRIGRAFGEWLQGGQGAKTIVIGGDVRLTSEALKLALANGLMDAGVNVIDLGMTGTEEIYFATFHLGADGGVEVTASHNPLDYNGMKLVREGSKPISGDTGLKDIQRMAEANQFSPITQRGTLTPQSCLTAYVQHLLGYITPQHFNPLKLVVNAGNGAAGHVVDVLEAEFQRRQIPITLIKVHNEPDGTFPHGIPNPLLPECRADTSNAVLAHQADMGIAWDGDFDRCFLFDENGAFIEGYYIVGLLAEAFLKKQPGAKIIHDPRLTWNSVDIAHTNGGVAIQSKTGHAFIKERMRAEDAVYGGEMSAHHYFRDFAYCDSGMIPWLLVAELLCTTGKTLGQLVSERIAAYPCSGEINFRVQDVQASITAVKAHFLPPSPPEGGGLGVRGSPLLDLTDGLSMEFTDWRFNLRGSNTEPVLRLNVESRGDAALMQAKTQEIRQLLETA
jgi:phosphomannomutase